MRNKREETSKIRANSMKTSNYGIMTSSQKLRTHEVRSWVTASFESVDRPIAKAPAARAARASGRSGTKSGRRHTRVTTDSPGLTPTVDATRERPATPRERT